MTRKYIKSITKIRLVLAAWPKDRHAGSTGLARTISLRVGYDGLATQVPAVESGKQVSGNAVYQDLGGA